MVHGDRSRHHALAHEGATQNDAPLVVDLNDVAVGDAPRSRIRRIDPHRFVLISIETPHFAGGELPAPGDVVSLSMHAPAGVVGKDEQWILLGPNARYALVMGDAFLDPLGNRRAFFVIGEVFKEIE